MKLRISGNSIRLRLGRQEVAGVAAGQVVEERTELSPTCLVCTLCSSPTAAHALATFESGRLEVVLPVAAARQWAESDQVGIDATLSTGSGRPLRLLVEKDFKCLHGDDQEQADAYPHPLDPAGG